MSLLDTVRTEIISAAIRLGQGQARGEIIAESVEKKLIARHGGHDSYVPLRSTAQLDRAVERLFDGTNHTRVMELLTISRATLYRSIARLRK